MNSNDPAFPTYLTSESERGLTKREYIATQIMAALDQDERYTPDAAAAIKYTDSLIAELSKP